MEKYRNPRATEGESIFKQILDNDNLKQKMTLPLKALTIVNLYTGKPFKTEPLWDWRICSV